MATTHNHKNQNSILFVFFIIGLIALASIFRIKAKAHHDYSRPASWGFDSVQVERILQEEQRQKNRQDSLKQYLHNL